MSKGPQLQTWLYSFQRPFFRYGVLEANRNDEGRQRAARVGNFVERFLAPRGHEFLVRALRIYAEAGETQRAGMLKSLLLTSDRPEVWGMSHDLLKYFDAVQWPDPMRRTVYMNLLDRLVQGGQVEAAETLFNEAIQWASEREDRAMQAWVLFAGSRLDFRRQDLYRARDRAKDALTLYKGLEDKLKLGELCNHLALVELSDGNPTAALSFADQAVESADIPPIQAHASFVRGLVARRERKFEDAVEHFRKANEVAGNAGQGALALEAGVNLGEALLISRQTARAADVLARCVQIAQVLRNPVRERSATSLLGQAQAAQKLPEAALRSAQRTLELSEKLQFKQFIALDTYNVGLFTMQQGKLTEAVALFRKAKEALNPNDPMLTKELHFHLGGALKAVGEMGEARKAFEACIGPAAQTRDFPKLVASRGELAELALQQGDKGEARTQLKAALRDAEQAKLKEQRKLIKRRLDSIR